MAEAPQVWKEKRVVESSDVDLLGRLLPHILFSYLLNAAWNHANNTRYGYAELSERNLMWVLIKFQMVISIQPKWYDQLSIETWGKRIERIYALRDFRVSAPSGATQVSATSSWLILDRNTGRPQRFDANTDGFPWQPQKEEIETNMGKVSELQGGRKVASFRVYFSDIDINRHVGSAKYLQWFMDSHSLDQLEKATPQAIDLSFLTEALPDDELFVISEQRNEIERCSLRRANDSKELCRARIKWGRTDRLTPKAR
jgi:medium-chain acyl-[acyl-carrier-protein] hydrolase